MDTSTITSVALLVFLIAFAGAWLMVARQENLESRSVKILLFALYFWALVFAQTAVGGLFRLIF